MGTTRFLEDQLNRPSRSLMSSSIDNILHRLMSIPVDNRSLISAFSHYGLTGNRKILSKAEVYHLNKFGIPLATDTEERVVQSIIDASDGATRIYGSAFELCTHLKFFRNFVGADWFFKLNEFYPIPEIRISMKKRQFVCKQELFDAMHVQMILLVDPFNTPMVGSVGFIFVKYMKRHVEDCYEMVELERLKSLNIAYEKMFRHEAETELAGEKQWGDVESESDLLKLWKQLLPSENVEFGYEEFKKDLEHFCKDCPLRENMSAHKEVFMICSKLVHCFQQLIDQNPRIFRPFLSTKNNDDPIAIRLFYDNSHRFLMYNEVRKAMIKVANSGSEHVVKDDSAEMGGIACPDGFLSTLSMREVVSCFEREGLSMDRIELIPTIISRAKHSAVPIITSSGDHCKLISDVFFELMREAIFGKKFFQRANGNWRLIEKVFASFDHWFRPMKTVHFLRYDEIPIILNELEKFTMITLAKDVRNAKVDGFTVENLKNELRNLGLLATFPNIHQHAQLAYDTVLKAKKDTYLRTCDLFDAVEQCQLLCFLEKMPKYAHFVHLQHSCNRVVGLKCKWCEKEKKTKRVEPQRAADQIMPPLVKIVHNQESPLKKPLVIVEKMVLPETSQQPEKESGCCKKCLRTSEMCNAAKEELKLERNRSKSLEKKVNAAEKVLNGVKEREKKKREAIERKLNEATKKIECLQKENEVASKKIERLTSENKETTEKLLKRNEEFLSACGTISRLEAEKEEHETTVRTLLEKIAEMSEKANVFHQPPPGILPSTSLSSVVSQQIVCGDANAVMLKLLEIKRFLVSEDHLGKAGEIAEQLISMNKSEGIFDGVTFEMERYHDAFNTFAYVVDQNIQKIECDPSISYQEMLSLPDFPSFSDRFMHEYEMAIKETSGPKAQKAKRDELEDNECLVCLTEMGDTEETIKCHHCKRRYHSECAVEWLKIKSVCPACNSGLLDPAEFPDL